MSKPLIYADYQKADGSGRLILVCYGTLRDLEKYGVVLEEGLALTFYMDDADAVGNPDNLLVDGRVELDHSSGHWVAVIDRDTFRHANESRTS